MLAQSGAAKPPSGAEWIHEVKWDGIRCLVHASEGAVKLRSRSGRDITGSYPEIEAAALALNDVVLDGEVVAMDEAGVPSFELLQQRMNVTGKARVASAASDVPVTCVVFDVLHAGEPLIDRPLEYRRERLANLQFPPGMVLSQSYEDGAALWQFVLERSIEGAVSKRRRSLYRPGMRSSDWVKTVAFRSVRAVVGGFTEGEGGRSGGFGALQLGLMEAGRLRWIGSVGSGFSEDQVTAVRAALDEMRIAESPFHPDRGLPRNVAWVNPALVAMVQYKQWTSAGRLRGPSFKGFTDDAVDAVTWESEGPEA